MLRAMERHLELLAASRQWNEVAVLSRRALSLDPDRECHYRYLVRAQLRLGHRRETLAGCHEYEAAMIKGAGLPLSEQMKSLADPVMALGRSGHSAPG